MATILSDSMVTPAMVPAAQKDRIHEILSKVQGEVIVPKGRRNEFNGFNYRNAEDIISTVKPICTKYGAVLTLTDDLVAIADRVYVKATATLTTTDGKDSISTTAYAQDSGLKMSPPQQTGACSSYARKYALAGLFGIGSEKDPDAYDNTK